MKVGSKVELKKNVLQKHARSVPSHLGYTKEQFAWRKTLRELKGKTGKVTKVFPSSSNVNVKFGKTLIGISKTELSEIKKKVKK